MDLLMHIALVTTSVCAVAVMLRRAGRKSNEPSIEVGAVSPRWLTEQRVRRKEWTGID